jgi:hypothetical protein
MFVISDLVLSKSIGGRPGRMEGGLLNTIHVAIAGGDAGNTEIEALCGNERAKLETLGVRVVSVLKSKAKKDPSYFNFSQIKTNKEDSIGSNLCPTFMTCRSCPGCRQTSTSSVFLRSAATRKSTLVPSAGASQVVSVRAISHSPGLITEAGDRKALTQGPDELERAQSNSLGCPPVLIANLLPLSLSGSRSNFRRTCVSIPGLYELSQESIGLLSLEVASRRYRV